MRIIKLRDQDITSPCPSQPSYSVWVSSSSFQSQGYLVMPAQFAAESCESCRSPSTTDCDVFTVFPTLTTVESWQQKKIDNEGKRFHFEIPASRQIYWYECDRHECLSWSVCKVSKVVFVRCQEHQIQGLLFKGWKKHIVKQLNIPVEAVGPDLLKEILIC